MNIEAAREYLRHHHRAVLATRRSDGGVQMSPIVATVDADGRAVISSQGSTAKVRNLQRDPHATLCVLSDDFYSDWIQVEGRVTIVPLPDAMEALVDYYRSISGEHPDWDDYRQAMENQRRVVIRIDIESAGPDAHA